MMYDIYSRPVRDNFVGGGLETLIVKDGIILEHVRGWDDESVYDNFRGPLKGKLINQRGRGWRKLSGFEAENVQGWAGELVE
jgi:hypothetical protein